MNLPDRIHPNAVYDALLNVGMTINEIRALTGDTAPTIIRTVEELDALDPHTVMQPPLDELGLWPRTMSAESLKWSMRTWNWKHLPAAVLAPAEQVRAARKALEEA